MKLGIAFANVEPSVGHVEGAARRAEPPDGAQGDLADRILTGM